MRQIETTHSIHNPFFTAVQHKVLKTLLESYTEPFLDIQSPNSVEFCGFSDGRFAFWGAVDVFCACGAEELVGLVC